MTDTTHAETTNAEVAPADQRRAARQGHHRGDRRMKDEEFKLTAPSNHAKIGVTTSGDKHYATSAT